MNEYYGDQLLWVRLFFEALGIFILSFGILTANGEAWRMANGLTAAILITRDFSGAHLNPAITFMLICCPVTKMNFRTGFMYWMAQLTGTYLSLLVYYLMFGEFKVKQTPATLTGADSLRCFVSEGAGFFMPGYATILQFNPRTRVTSDKFLTAVFVVTMVLLGIEISSLSGSFMNPAIATGYFTFFTWWNNDSKLLNELWVYIAGPFLGAGVAGYFYWVMYSYILEPNEKDLKEKLGPQEELQAQEAQGRQLPTFGDTSRQQDQKTRGNQAQGASNMSHSVPIPPVYSGKSYPPQQTQDMRGYGKQPVQTPQF